MVGVCKTSKGTRCCCSFQEKERKGETSNKKLHTGLLGVLGARSYKWAISRFEGDTLESLNCLALSLDSMGRLDQAELLYRRAVAVGARGARGYSQLEQLTSTCNLGSCWRRMGRSLDSLLMECCQCIGPSHFSAVKGLSHKRAKVKVSCFGRCPIYHIDHVFELLK